MCFRDCTVVCHCCSYNASTLATVYHVAIQNLVYECRNVHLTNVEMKHTHYNQHMKQSSDMYIQPL